MTVIRWTCTNCGRLLATVRAPDRSDAKPVKCGWCGSTTFTKHEAAA